MDDPSITNNRTLGAASSDLWDESYAPPNDQFDTEPTNSPPDSATRSVHSSRIAVSLNNDNNEAPDVETNSLSTDNWDQTYGAPDDAPEREPTGSRHGSPAPPSHNVRTASPLDPNAGSRERNVPNYQLQQGRGSLPAMVNRNTQNTAMQQENGGTRPLRRELGSVQIFMIAINAVIGMGYYINTGTILHMGGPGAIVYTYVFLGCLTLMVMRGLAIMLRIWPVAGALVLFVEKFVDEEVGKTVAVLYWLTYCFSFAGLTTTLGGLVAFFGYGKGVEIALSLLSLAVVFRWIEFGLGSIKLMLALCIIIIMNAINPDVGKPPASEHRGNNSTMQRDVVFQHEDGKPGGWFAAISASIFLASFSFVGIEVVAATAQEASIRPSSTEAERTNDGGIELPSYDDRPPLSHENPSLDTESPPTLTAAPSHQPFEYAMWVPTVATAVYLWGGWIVSQNMDWKDPSLLTSKSDSSLPNNASSPVFVNSTLSGNTSSSVFVNSAGNHSRSSAHALTWLLIIIVASTSSTALYVASRTLFGLAYTAAKKSENESSTYWSVTARFLSRTNKFGVPNVAVIVSSWLFWMPFLKYMPSSDSFSSASHVITEMASVSCLLVWALESLAAFRFYKCYKKHHGTTPSVPDSIKSIAKVDNKAWYYLHLAISGSSVLLCCLVIILGGTMACLLNPNPRQGVAAFLVIGVFFILTYVLKWLNRHRQPDGLWLRLGIDLDNGEKVTQIFQELNEQFVSNNERYRQASLSAWDLFGMVDSQWIKGKLGALWRRQDS